jgi:hypothetical protein
MRANGSWIPSGVSEVGSQFLIAFGSLPKQTVEWSERGASTVENHKERKISDQTPTAPDTTITYTQAIYSQRYSEGKIRAVVSRKRPKTYGSATRAASRSNVITATKIISATIGEL